jgi:DNA-binding transcriptional LysR family regulator
MHLDLNLLNALDVLLEERSVLRAAERLHVSQPAMSRTLGRIRAATGDRIFVRVGHRMEPTSYAISVREQVRSVVRQGKDLLQPNQAVNLATTKRTLTISMNELILAVFGWRLLRMVQAVAPGIRLRLISETSVRTNELQRDQVDLQLNAENATSPALCSELVFEDQLAVALRPGHPSARRKLSLQRYAAGQHVIVSRRGRLRDGIDVKIEAFGLRREVVATVATTEAALAIACASDCFVVVPRRVSQMTAAATSISFVDMPMPMDPLPLFLTWHTRHQRDAVHAWLREQIRNLFIVAGSVRTRRTEGQVS